jgi:hypothetical protein
MQHNGWWLHSVHDGKKTVNLARLSPHEARLRAMETIFSLDDASLRFLRPQPGDTETVVRHVLMIPSNGAKIVSDWTCAKDDSDGFGACMHAALAMYAA